MNIEELKVRISADISSLKSSINKVKSSAKEIQQASAETSNKIKNNVKDVDNEIKKSASNNTANIKSFLSKAKVMVAAAVASIIVIAKKALNIASDLEEVQNVVDVSFGNMADSINEFAKSALKSFGLSELSAKQFSSTFMSIANGLGIASDAGQEMSVNLTKLTGDMASFFNISQDTAATALKSVFTGETEALKKYGIVLTETNLKNYALAKGITKAYSEMTSAEKVALRYNYIMEATSQVQGDFARTSTSWANQLRILTENWKNLISILGELLIKVLNPIVTKINIILESLTKVGNSIKEKFLGKAESSTNSATNSMENYAESVDNASESIANLKKSTAGFDELNKLSVDTPETTTATDTITIDKIDYSGIESSLDETESSLIDKITEVMNKVIETISKTIEPLKPAFNTIKESVVTLFEALGPAVEELLPSISSLISTIVQTVLPPLVEIIKALMPIITKIINSVLPVLKKVLEALQPVLNTIINTVLPVVVSLLESLMPLVEGLLDVVVAILEPVLQLISPLLELVVNILKPILAIVQPMIEYVGRLMTVLASLLKPILSLLSPLYELYNSLLGPIMDILSKLSGTVTDKILNAFTVVQKVVAGFIVDCIDKFKEKLNSLVDVAKKVGDTFTKVFNTIKSVISACWTGIKVIINTMIGGFEKFVNSVIKGINSMITALNKLSFDVPSWVPKIGGEKFGFNIKTIEEVKIPKLATGGIVNQSTIANIGEAGPEAILPLDNTNWMDKLADRFALKLLNQQPEKIVLNVDGRQLGWATINNINSITKQTGNLQLSLG